MCGALSSFCPPPFCFPLCICARCLSSWGRGGLWLGSQVLPAIGAVSILELAVKSGSSRMSLAPNLHIVTQFFNVIQQSQSWPCKRVAWRLDG